MQHCDGGPGADAFGQVGKLNFDDPAHSVDAALECWVEKGTAPSTINASKDAGEDKRHAKITRPWCAYPQTAKYKESGDTDGAAIVCDEKK